MKKTAKLLVLLLSVALIIGALVMVVGAEGGTYTYYDANEDEVTTDSFAEAVANGDGSVTLNKDVTIAESYAIDSSIFFDLNGHTVTSTVDTPVFTVTDGESYIYSGTIDSASSVVFDVQAGTVTVSGLTVKIPLATDGVTAAPALSTLKTGVGTLSDEGGNTVTYKSLFEVRNSGSTTYYATEAAFRAKLGAPTENDVIVMNSDISLTGTVNPLGDWSSETALRTYTLDVNGYTLDANGYTIADLTTDSLHRHRQGFNLKSSRVGGVINSFKHFGPTSWRESVNGEPLIKIAGQRKYVNIYGTVDETANGATSLTVNAAALFRADIPSNLPTRGTLTYISVIGGLYNQVAGYTYGFISSSASTGLASTASSMTFTGATFVQAYYYPGYDAGIKDRIGQIGLDRLGGGDMYIPELFYFDIWRQDAAYIRPETAPQQFVLTDCTVIGKAPTTSVFASESYSGQIVYNNCVVSADIAPRHATSGGYAFEGGRVVIGEGTTFSTCTAEIKDYSDAVTSYNYTLPDSSTGAKDVVESGTFLAADMKAFQGPNPANIALPSLPSAAEREGAFTIQRPFVVNATKAHNTAGVFDKTAGYYFVVENGADIDSIISAADLAAAYEGEQQITPAKGNLAIVLGTAAYKAMNEEDYQAALDAIPKPIFTITNYEGTSSVDYYDYSDWVKVLETYKTASGTAYNEKSILKGGDTVTLKQDITYTGDIDARMGKLWGIVFDLNGHTIDASASSKPFMRVGDTRNGQNDGRPQDLGMAFTLTSSVEGGKLIHNANAEYVFDVRGSYKTLNILGADAEGNTTLTIEAKCLVNIQGYGGASDTDSVVTINGGEYTQVDGSANNYFRTITASDFSDSQINVSNATFTSNSTTSNLVGLITNTETPRNTTMAGAGIYFDNCTITMQHNTVMAVTNPESVCQITNTVITVPVAQGLGTSNGGKVLLGNDVVLINANPDVLAYNADAIADPSGDSAGFYYAAPGLQKVKTSGETKYSIVDDEANKVIFVANGNTLSTEWYLATDANVLADAPSVTLVNDYIATQTMAGWNSAAEGNVVTYTADIQTAYSYPEMKVNATLKTQLGINIYLPEQYAKDNTDFEFVASDMQGFWVATIGMDSNKAFTTIVESLTFEVEGVTHELQLAAPLSVFTYIGVGMAGNDLDDDAKEVLYYMASYLKAAYAYMNVEGESTFVQNLGYDSFDEAFDDIISDFTPVNAYNPVNDKYKEYNGYELGVEIAVDLKSTPEYVFILNGDAKSVAVNGTMLDVVDGVSVYADANIHNFDKNITVTTYDADGAEIATDVFYLGNYAYAIKDDVAVNAVVEALYKYILAADNYNPAE